MPLGPCLGIADSILNSCMCCSSVLQDKAALLASMEPDAVAQLLGCMDPHEAVLLLSALGDSSSTLVSNCLTSEDRDKLLQVGQVVCSLSQKQCLLRWLGCTTVYLLDLTCNMDSHGRLRVLQRARPPQLAACTARVAWIPT